MTPEGKVKKQVVEVLKTLGAYYFFPATGGYGRSGVPDVVACLDGQFIAIECKAGKNKPTALQERELLNINKAHGIAFVVDEGSIHALAEALGHVQDTLRIAIRACMAGNAQGVLVTITQDKVKLHGLNINEEDALALLGVATLSCTQDTSNRVLQ